MPDAAPVTNAFGAMVPKARVMGRLQDRLAYARQAVVVVGGEPVLLLAGNAKGNCYRRALGRESEAPRSLTWQIVRVWGLDDIMSNG
jgi:hypothetical protein